MKPEPSEAQTTPPAPAGIRRLYKTAEDAIGPLLPRGLRDVWRRMIGRPPLPVRAEAPTAATPLPAAPKTFDVVCFPIIAWSFRFQRPQQLMRELGRQGHRVFWVDPDSIKDGIGGHVRGELAANVFDVGLRGEAPRDPFRDSLRDPDLDELMLQLRALQRDAGLASVIAIVQLPFWAPLARRAQDELGWTIVYDCMDDHAAFSTNDDQMLAGEDWLMRKGALVVTTSRRLRARAESKARRVVSIPNACDYDHFARAAQSLPKPAALDGIPKPIVGYIGAISEWFDFDLLRHAIGAHPEWNFVLVGSTWGAGPHEDLQRAANVHFLGEQPYVDLPPLLSAFDVACIPFQLTPLIEATDPVKLYEYQAARKPVVASRLLELEAHAERVALVDTPEQFTDAIEAQLAADGPQQRQKRAAFAEENTWANRAAVLEAALEATFAPVSICIVTWNNLPLTRACLDSVLADRSWPNVEVIVVDNASSDETPAYLCALAERDSRVRIELNDDNRGFAAANNQAIEISSGRWVVLLNNDTAVPRGWLSGLIRVLEDDPTIGLIGPVTDGVWNEARVDGVTVRADQVDTFAAQWAREHTGRVYPIGMLAMYCVAAPRAVVEQVGALDERFGIGMFEDDDYAHRVRRAGFRLACAEEVFVHHAGQASFDKLSRKNALWEENRAKFEEKWGAAWRPPGLGTRTRVLAHREELARHLEPYDGRTPVVLLSGTDGVDPEAAAIAEGLGAQGHPVLDVRLPGTNEEERGIQSTGSRLVSTLPLEAFDELPGAIVLPSASRTFDLAYFRRARVVYVDEPEASYEARQDLLGQAEIVVGEGATEATRVPRGETSRVLALLGTTAG
ncbi:MAG: glycosyltransferase [Candidatus Binatia bacterium]|nr:glycosyltransferase [Candidatus Binatia bacterium]